MILIGLLLGLAGGLLVGGQLSALVNVRLRFAALIIAAIVLRYGTQILIAQGVGMVDTLRWPLYAAAFGSLIGALWLNRRSPGLIVVMVGVAFNATAILVNGGWMPVYVPAVTAAGLSPTELSATYHIALPLQVDLTFLRMAGPLGDIIPFPAPLLPNVVSLGDLLIGIGLGWFVFATLRWGDPAPDDAGISLWAGHAAPATALEPRIGDRPIVLGGGVGPGLAPPERHGGEPLAVPWAIAPPGAVPVEVAATNVPAAATPVAAAPAAVVAPRPSWLARVRAHPYVRLARDSRFSAFWIGQTISVFGDRLNQVALSAYVLYRTQSAALSGLVFVVSMVPNLFIGPIAGTLVDRWEHKRVMVSSDLLRAALVVLIPVAIATDVGLVYPIVFLITTVSLFFRPARAAVLPRIVSEDDLLPANSAMWTGETLADIGGYPLAGLLVAFLGANVAIAFWLDAASYLVSAVLIAGIFIPPVVRTVVPRVSGAIRAFLDELRAGWRFLRDSPPLFQNTLISVVGQLSVGATIALTPFFVLELLGHPAMVDGVIPGQAETMSAVDTAIGIGNLIGAFVIGAIGSRMRKGRLVIGGFTLMGIATVAWGLSGSTAMVLVSALAVGVFNLVWLVPSQTLFGELVPSELMGRVIAMRGSLVFGAMTASAAICSVVAGVVSAGTVFAIMGAITVIAGLAGLFLPAVRDT